MSHLDINPGVYVVVSSRLLSPICLSGFNLGTLIKKKLSSIILYESLNRTQIYIEGRKINKTTPDKRKENVHAIPNVIVFVKLIVDLSVLVDAENLISAL